MKRTSGFTLLELLAVMAILGVLAVVAMAGVRPTNADLLAEIGTVKAHLRFAQGRAMNDTVTWGVTFTGNGYTLVKGDGSVPPPLPGGIAVNRALSGVTCTTPGTVMFDEWGSPGANTLVFSFSGGGQADTVTVTRNTGFIP